VVEDVIWLFGIISEIAYCCNINLPGGSRLFGFFSLGNLDGKPVSIGLGIRLV
jgi:hypothetical protein